MRVLVSAYACEPEKGSEPGVGWNWVRHMARLHEVWVITRKNNRESIEKALDRKTSSTVHWVYFDLPRWLCFWKKRQRGVHAYYYLWQAGAYFAARRLRLQVNFDVVHHVTFVNYWMPSFLAMLPVPFIWGPVGGGESAPRNFCRSFSFRGNMYELVRDIARSFGRLDPFVRMTARRSALAFATTQQTEKRLLALGCREVLVLSESGLPTEEFNQLSSLPLRVGSPFRLLSLGRLLHWKGFEFGVRAFAHFHSAYPASEYWIVGDGPERTRLERLTRELGIAGEVAFWGKLTRACVLEKLSECDALVHPSMHDSGGWVCLEAMAAGRPVICLDLGGPAAQVSEETGVKVAPISPEQVVHDLAVAMEQLANDPARRVRLGQAARQRVAEHFSWARKSALMAEVYTHVKEESCHRTGGTRI